MTEEELTTLLGLLLNSQNEHGKTLGVMAEFITASAEISKRLNLRIGILEAKIKVLEKEKTAKIVKDFYN
jgi:hypothetical protein